MPSALQDISLGEELNSAMRLLKTGFRELNRLDGSTDFFHLPILLLASGFERMMKVVICCHHLETHGSYPLRGHFTKGRNGHDLVHLLERICRECFSDKYLACVPAANTDIMFLRSDAKLSAILKILSDFGQSARYYNLNVVMDEKDPGPSPDQEWQALEMEVLKEDPSGMRRLKIPAERKSIYRQINTGLTIECEKLARALARLFTIGDLGRQGRRISTYTHHFLFLQDEQLGKNDYEKITI